MLEDEVNRITVRRTHIWDDSMKALRRVDVRKQLKVTFLGEAAVDDGGPRREYLRLLMAVAMEQSHLLAGPACRKVPVHNALAVQRGDFHMLGVIIVLSLTQGGPAPIFFAPSIVDYLFGGCGNIRASIGDIPDCDVQDKLFKVSLMCITKMINNPHPLYYSFRKFPMRMNSRHSSTVMSICSGLIAVFPSQQPPFR